MVRLAACVGQDDEEDRASARMHCLQIQDAARYQALQAVRFPRCPHAHHRYLRTLYSFELGGEKKTKGAALQFVSILSSRTCLRLATVLTVRVVIVSALSSYPCLAIRIIAATIYHPRIM